jgi:4-amino-4-deoxy-L-arabinose transferase-like glycosyltransferase
MRAFVVVGAILLAALGLRLAYVAVTPGYAIVHDARGYDEHAQSIARGEGFSERFTGKPTAFRPPGYAYLLGGAYRLFGAQAEADRIRVARVLGAVLGALGVALIGVVANRLWGRRVALTAMVLAALYVPSLFVATAVMTEQLFVVFMLAALAVALALKDSPHPYRLAAAAGLLTGLAVLTRANGLILLAPLAFAAWRSSWRAAAILVAVALVTVAPWTIRNAYELHAFVPTTTQLGWALAGTYNDQARTDPDNPASWRSLFRVPEFRAIDRRHPGEPEATRERRWRSVALEYIREHPTYVATVAYWNTRRLLDLVSRDWSRHTASTVSVTPGWSDIGVVCFWVFAVLALFARRVREAPAYVWAVPLLMYVSVVLLASETPRYRAALDPFVILLAALALQRLQEAPDALRQPLRRFRREREPDERAGRLGGEERASG